MIHNKHAYCVSILSVFNRGAFRVKYHIIIPWKCIFRKGSVTVVDIVPNSWICSGLVILLQVM